MEGVASKPSPSESAPEGPPPKKKRTRTLTTPHQAAVLHALLAQVRIVFATMLPCRALTPVSSQSRFPTTQMREEVGRSIGLSARKVQVRRLPLCLLSRGSFSLSVLVGPCEDLVPGECPLILPSLPAYA